MNDENKKSSSKKRILLLILALVFVGLIGFLATKPANHDGVVPTPEEEVSEVVEPTEETPTETQTQTATEETITEGATSAPVATGEKVTIDINAAFSARTVGDSNAPIKIIEYASLTCSHCAHFHNDVYPTLKSKYIDTGKVFLEFREFPLNDPALKATLIARCLPEEQYEPFISTLFKSFEQWAEDLNYMERIKQNAKLAGMSDETVEACLAQGDLKLKIADQMQVAQDKWKISATPTFIINDGAEVISGAKPLEEFERIFRKITEGAVAEVPAVE